MREDALKLSETTMTPLLLDTLVVTRHMNLSHDITSGQVCEETLKDM
jgi:hypothetical protein